MALSSPDREWKDGKFDSSEPRVLLVVTFLEGKIENETCRFLITEGFLESFIEL